jgi:hypothetical protein
MAALDFRFCPSHYLVARPYSWLRLVILASGSLSWRCVYEPACLNPIVRSQENAVGFDPYAVHIALLTDDFAYV